MAGFPHWQVVLVDLRCHGESAALSPLLRGAHGLEAAAADVIRLLSHLRLFPEMLIGHSFGGKVVLQMTHHWSQAARRVPRPVQVCRAEDTARLLACAVRSSLHWAAGPWVLGAPTCSLIPDATCPQVWVLDALPGEVRSGDMGGADRPADLISTLQQLPLPLPSRHWLISRLEEAGFSRQVAAWAATNLTPLAGGGGLGWSFDLSGIAQMFRCVLASGSAGSWNVLLHCGEGGHHTEQASTFPSVAPTLLLPLAPRLPGHTP